MFWSGNHLKMTTFEPKYLPVKKSVSHVVTPHGVTAHGVTAPVGTGRNGKPLRRRGARTWQRANHSTWGSLAFDGSDSVVQTNPTVPSPCFAVDWKITIFQGAAKKWKPPTKMTAPYRYVPRCSGFLNVQIFWNQNFRRLENYWYYVFKNILVI